MRTSPLALCALVTLAACADDGATDELPAPTDGLPLAPETGEWIAVEPGGDTICSRGTPFRFFVRGGDSDKVIIDFQGGGACWDEVTCSIADSLFRDAAPELSDFSGPVAEGTLAGIFDSDPTSLFADWTIVHIPYCTGDVHWGNATQSYGTDLTIEHKGFVNVGAALDWTYARFDPERVFVSGCSAGAYGAIMHSAYIADHYQDAKISVLADSGAGIITDSFLDDSLPNWGAQDNIPPFIPSLQIPITDLTLPDLYVGIGGHYPEHRFAQTATNFDADQIFYFSAMGGDRADWPGLFRGSLSTIESQLPNFRAYVPGGSMHCVTPYPFFADRSVGGVGLETWTEQLVMGDEPPASVGCEGQECCNDPVCAECMTGVDHSWCRFCAGWPDSWPECAGG